MVRMQMRFPSGASFSVEGYFWKIFRRFRFSQENNFIFENFKILKFSRISFLDTIQFYNVFVYIKKNKNINTFETFDFFEIHKNILSKCLITFCNFYNSFRNFQLFFQIE